jgi:hypothetical protein
MANKKEKPTLEELLAKKQEVADWGGGTVKFPRPQPGPIVKVSKMDAEDDEKQKMLKSIIKRSRA